MRKWLGPALIGLAIAGSWALALAGTGTISVKDSNGNPQTYAIVTNGSGNFVSEQVLCDQAAAANCLQVDTNNAAKTNLGEVGGTAVALGQTTMSASIPVVLPSNQGSVPVAATVNVHDYQNDAGTNGFTQAPFSVLTTELNSLASAGVATSSVNGTSGVFNQTNTGNDIFGRCWLKLGGALGGTAVAGANVSIWYLTSTDGGTTFESQTVSPPPRAPDIVIPIGANAYAANAILMSPPRQYLWSESVKIVLQNNTGQAMASSGNILTCAGEATNH